MTVDEALSSGQVFDVVVLANVLHHVPPVERESVMASVRSLMKPSGWLFLFELNPANPLVRRVVAKCPFDKDAVLLDMKETLRLAEKLRIERHGYMTFFPSALSCLRGLERYMARLPFGAQHFVAARYVS